MFERVATIKKMSAEVEGTVVVGENSKHKTSRHETRWVLVNKDDDVLSATVDVENQKVADILFSDRPTLKQLQPFAAMLDSDDNEEEEDVITGGGKSRRAGAKKRDSRRHAPYKNRAKHERRSSAKVASTAYLLEHWSVGET